MTTHTHQKRLKNKKNKNLYIDIIRKYEKLKFKVAKTGRNVVKKGSESSG